MNNQYRDDEMELEHLVFLYGFRTAATGRKGLSADRSDSHYCEGYALGKRFRQEKIDAGYIRIRRPSNKVIHEYSRKRKMLDLLNLMDEPAVSARKRPYAAVDTLSYITGYNQYMDRRRILTGAVGASIAAAHFDKGWVRPVVRTVVLPAHAETSSYDRWLFEMTFTEICEDCGAAGLPEELKIFRELPPPHRKVSIEFGVSEDEIDEGEFRKIYDQDGSGPGADFFEYSFKVTAKNHSSMEGTVIQVSVDNAHHFGGPWKARII